MATSRKIFCGPCGFKHICTSAVVWCPICNEGICVNCRDQHSAFSLTRHHEVLDIENYMKLPVFVSHIEMTCYEHDQKLDFYCSTHNDRCCLACIPDKHQECPNVAPMEVIVKNVKTSPAFMDAFQGVEDLVQNINEIIRVKQINWEDLKQTKAAIETEIRFFRKEINDLLDKFENQTLHNLNDISSRQNTADKKVLDNLINKKVEMELFRANCENINALASDFQAFVAIQHISEKLSEEESKLMSLLGTNAIQSSVLKFDKNESLSSLKTKLKDLGTINISSNDPNFKLSQRKHAQAQFMSIPKEKSEYFQTLDFRLMDFLSIPKTELNITDCTILPDDRCVLTNVSASKRLFTIKPLSKLIADIPLPFSVCGVTSIERSIVALLVEDENKIQIIELQNTTFKLKREIKLKNRGWSISCCNDKIACSVKNVGILLISKTGYIQTIPMSYLSYVAVNITSDKLYYSNGPEIHCCCHNGTDVWKYSIADQCSSLATDNEGHVYVACSNTNEIVIISADGGTSKTVRFVNSPRALAFNKKRNELLYVTSNGLAGFLGLY